MKAGRHVTAGRISCQLSVARLLPFIFSDITVKIEFLTMLAKVDLCGNTPKYTKFMHSEHLVIFHSKQKQDYKPMNKPYVLSQT